HTFFLSLTFVLLSFLIVKPLIPCAMFDFTKLDVYQKAKLFCVTVHKSISSKHLNRTADDQLRRASLSVMLNIAEGSSRFSNKDRKNFMVIARGSAFESAAILEYLFEISAIKEEEYNNHINNLEEISKMLFGLIQHLDKH
ncbi:MAG TPA: four helix bundle protein, partial [Bacteroidales bacterium]|nr:four helix bundle protein [Bacteroidales bacterium]